MKLVDNTTNKHNNYWHGNITHLIEQFLSTPEI